MRAIESFISKAYSSFKDYVPLKYGNENFGFSSNLDLHIKPFTQENNFYKCFITKELIELVSSIGVHRELGK